MIRGSASTRAVVIGLLIASVLAAPSARAEPDDGIAQAETELAQLESTPMVVFWPGFGSADTAPVFSWLDRARAIVRAFESFEPGFRARARIGVARTCEAVVRAILGLRVETTLGSPEQVAGQADAIRGGLEDTTAEWQCRAIRAYEVAVRDGSLFETAPARAALDAYPASERARCRLPTAAGAGTSPQP
jgi:hypothetical protein